MSKKTKAGLKTDPAPAKESKAIEKKIIRGKHKLTSEEKILNAEELATAMQDKEFLQARKKEALDGISKQIILKDELINECLDKIRTGEEDRDFECRVDRDYEKKEKVYVDIDSEVEIKRIPFTASDFQTEISQDELDEDDEIIDKVPE